MSQLYVYETYILEILLTRPPSASWDGRAVMYEGVPRIYKKMLLDHEVIKKRCMFNWTELETTSVLNIHRRSHRSHLSRFPYR